MTAETIFCDDLNESSRCDVEHLERLMSAISLVVGMGQGTGTPVTYRGNDQQIITDHEPP
jgi:hypothetical protein